MVPLLLIASGIVALGAGLAILRSFGPGYRVGRLLAATPAVSVADAVAIARAARDRPRYVRVTGRIDSAEEAFEDEHHRPLVFRRVRLDVRRDGDWAELDDTRRVVPFAVSEDLDAIGVDDAALDEGLVVIPRESHGVGADVAEHFPDTPRDAAVRMRVDQVSSVDHATVVGVPVLDPAGTPTMTSGLGRPLILTTLERNEAMRVLAAGSRLRPTVAAVALAGGTILLVAGIGLGLLGALTGSTTSVAGAASVNAADASPNTAAATPAGTADPATGDAASGQPGTGDTRSSGQGPGFVGAPLLAVGGVLLIAAGTIVLTLAYVRLTGGSPGGPPASPGGS